MGSTGQLRRWQIVSGRANAEPVMGEGGIIVPPDSYFARVKEILDEYDILFITDEVQSSFGRTGGMFAIEHYGVELDVLVMAKRIAGGFPLRAFIVPSGIVDSFQPGEHLSTVGGNPVSCAVALTNICVLLEERLPKRAAELGEWAMGRLHKIAKRYPTVGDVRGRGLINDREAKQLMPHATPPGASGHRPRADGASARGA